MILVGTNMLEIGVYIKSGGPYQYACYAYRARYRFSKFVRLSVRPCVCPSVYPLLSGITPKQMYILLNTIC